jgi:hypothetical protein
MTEDEIINEIENGATTVIVSPVYQQSTSSVELVVSYNNEIERSYVESGVVQVLTAKDLSAQGLQFKCWSLMPDGGNKEYILIYSETCKVVVNSRLDIYAIYEETSEEVSKEPTIVHTDLYSTVSSGVSRIGFSFTRDVPEGYTLVETGVLFNNTGDLDETYLAQDLHIGSSYAKKAVATNPASQGIYTAQIAYRGYTICARGYMIVKDDSTGNQLTLYTPVVFGTSDMIS